MWPKASDSLEFSHQVRSSADIRAIITIFNFHINAYFSEAQRTEQINHATGEAAALLAVAEARAKGLNIISESWVAFVRIPIAGNCIYPLTIIRHRLAKKDGKNAASFFVAEQYVEAFNNLARTNNTLILPSNVGNISSLVGEAMSIYSQITKSNESNTITNGTSDSASINSVATNNTNFNPNSNDITSKSSTDPQLS